MFCGKEEKWTEVPYVQLFFFLTDHPEWLSKFRIDTQTMVTVCKIPDSFEEPETPKPSSKVP
jgi:hypothetical protein